MHERDVAVDFENPCRIPQEDEPRLPVTVRTEPRDRWHELARLLAKDLRAPEIDSVRRRTV
jgi:hypothetical protein